MKNHILSKKKRSWHYGTKQNWLFPLLEQKLQEHSTSGSYISNRLDHTSWQAWMPVTLLSSWAVNFKAAEVNFKTVRIVWSVCRAPALASLKWKKFKIITRFSSYVYSTTAQLCHVGLPHQYTRWYEHYHQQTVQKEFKINNQHAFKKSYHDMKSDIFKLPLTTIPPPIISATRWMQMDIHFQFHSWSIDYWIYQRQHTLAAACNKQSCANHKTVRCVRVLPAMCQYRQQLFKNR